MPIDREPTKVTLMPVADAHDQAPLSLETLALEALRGTVSRDALAESYNAWRTGLNKSGGKPAFVLGTPRPRSQASYDDKLMLKDMTHTNLMAERVDVDAYSQRVRVVGDPDPTRRRQLEHILGGEQKHADELQGWLND